MGTVNVRAQTMADAQDLGRINDLLGQSLSRLSSGSRLIDASVDPVGVGAVAKYESQDKRAQAASVNVQNAASFVQSSTGFVASIVDVVTRMSELTQYASDHLKSSSDIALYQDEFQQLQDQLRQTIGGTTAEIGGTSDVTDPLGSYDGVVLFGSNPSGITIASGSHAGDTITIPETNLRTGAMLNLIQQDSSGNYTLSSTDATASQQIDAALDQLGQERSTLGGVQSRLTFTASMLASESANNTEAASRIQDVDVASETTRLAKMNMLLQASTSMLSQANQDPKSILKLLQT